MGFLQFLQFLRQQLETVQFLLAHGADITAKDKSQNTALHYAALNRHVNVVEFILNRGFAVDLENNQPIYPAKNRDIS